MLACTRSLVLGLRAHISYRIPLAARQHVPVSARTRGLIISCANEVPVTSETGDNRPLATAVKPIKYNVRPITKGPGPYADDVEIQFARSSGPGGQNVNKVNTKVDMRFAFENAGWIPAEEKNKINKEGLLVVTSTKHRIQAQNLEDALSKIQEMIDAAVFSITPKEVDPETTARVKKQIKAGKERRLDAKKKDGQRKKERSSKDWF